MGEKVTGEASGIAITKEDGYGEKVAKNIPIAGGLVKTGIDAKNAAADGQLSGTEVGGLATDAAGFVQSCTDAASGIATDPIGWLIGQGLNFLITLVQPIQDAIHVVSGDGPALGNAAGNFASIGTGLAKFAERYQTDAKQTLAQWQGEAADTANTKTTEFASGVQGIAAEAGNISQLLQISSMIMTVIEEFIKALLTELVTWLIMIWIPALAAAVPTCGASVAEAGGLSGVKGAETGAKATKQVSKLQRLLDKIRDLLAKMKDFMKHAGDALKKVNGERKLGSALYTDIRNSAKDMGVKPSMATKFYGDKGMVGKRVLGGFGESMLDKAETNLKEQVTKPGKITGHINNASKAGRAGNTGEEQSTEETRDDLDF